MRLVEILLIAVGLAMDAFAVSLGAGACGRLARLRPALRLSFHLGLFQALMPVLGWYAGTLVAGVVNRYAPWVAFALLSWVGGRMVYWGLVDRDQAEQKGTDPSRGLTMVMVCIATSIDAFAIGISLAMLKVAVWFPSAVIGVVTAAMCMVGIAIGSRLGTTFGKRMEVLGGLILIGIGLRIVLSRVLLQ
jgi:putative Mn2+ efflux pump MntP